MKVFTFTTEVCEPLWKLTLLHRPKLIWQNQTHHQEEDNCDILLWKTAAIFRYRCVGCQSRNKASASKGKMIVDSKEWSIWQHSAVANSTKSLTNMETHYSNIEREALGILHGLENFHHYCSTWKVNVITDHKPLVTFFKKEVASLSQRL